MTDAGNKFGEPVVTGFARSFGQQIHYTAPDSAVTPHTPAVTATASPAYKQRVEWLKPVMFTAGVGLLDDRHIVKGQPEPGMLVCKVGGPAYRIGK